MTEKRRNGHIKTPGRNNTRGFAPLSRFSWPLTQDLHRRQGFAGHEILRHWERIVGSDLHLNCMPERVQFRPVDKLDKAAAEASAIHTGVLTIRAQGVTAIELQHSAPQIIERINSYFGFAAIGRLKIVQAPLPRRKRAYKPVRKYLSPSQEDLLAHRLNEIQNPTLKQALDRLGREVLVRPLKDEN